MTMLAAMAICGCAKSIKPDAEPILIVAHGPDSKCAQIGDVEGHQGNWLTGKFTSDADLETGARNDLKNNALAKGGNVILVTVPPAAQKGLIGNQSVSFSGKAYKCPSWR
jgi:hypothetical protein